MSTPTHPAAEATHLLRSAMTFFDTDRAAAWRFLNHASTLLDRAVPDAPRRGGLPAWRAQTRACLHRGQSRLENHHRRYGGLGGVEQESLLSRLQTVPGIVPNELYR